MTSPTVPPTGNILPPPEHDDVAETSPGTVTIFAIGILVAIFGAVAIFVVVRVLNPPPPAFSEGDCVKVVGGSRSDAEVEKVHCGAEGALYEVGLYKDDPEESCPDEAYSSYEQTGGMQQKFRLCLMLNAEEGECLAMPVIAAGAEKKVACTSDDADRKVTKVVDGTADRSACDPGSADEARVYPDPERTVCLGPVTA